MTQATQLVTLAILLIMQVLLIGTYLLKMCCLPSSVTLVFALPMGALVITGIPFAVLLQRPTRTPAGRLPRPIATTLGAWTSAMVMRTPATSIAPCRYGASGRKDFGKFDLVFDLLA